MTLKTVVTAVFNEDKSVTAEQIHDRFGFDIHLVDILLTKLRTMNAARKKRVRKLRRKSKPIGSVPHAVHEVRMADLLAAKAHVQACGSHSAAVESLNAMAMLLS